MFLQHNESHPARATIKNLVKAIKRWDFSDDIKKDISNIDIPQRTARKGKPIPKFLKRSDLDKLEVGIHLADPVATERLKLIILIQFYAGLRVNELVNLSYNCFSKDNLKPDDKFQTIKVSAESAKFGRERVAYIPTELYLRAREWIKRVLYLFYKDKKVDLNKPLWDLKVSRYKKLLSDETLRILGEPYNTHSLRHGRGYDLRTTEHKPIDFIKEYLGHADIKSTQVYTHFGSVELKEELEKD